MLEVGKLTVTGIILTKSVCVWPTSLWGRCFVLLYMTRAACSLGVTRAWHGRDTGQGVTRRAPLHTTGSSVQNGQKRTNLEHICHRVYISVQCYNSPFSNERCRRQWRPLEGYTRHCSRCLRTTQQTTFHVRPHTRIDTWDWTTTGVSHAWLVWPKVEAQKPSGKSVPHFQALHNRYEVVHTARETL